MRKKMKIPGITYWLTSALIFLLIACKKDNNTIHDEDIKFLQEATQSNNAEITLGKLAMTNGQRDSVRIFGSLMVSEHTTMQSSVDSLAKLDAIPLNASLDSSHQALLQSLQTMTGYSFDTAYINNQVRDHQNMIRSAQRVLTDGHNVQIRQVAIDHLQRAQTDYRIVYAIFQSQ